VGGLTGTQIGVRPTAVMGLHFRMLCILTT
jgi:hypothetical protein